MRDQTLDLILRQRGKVLNKQGELQQSPVWIENYKQSRNSTETGPRTVSEPGSPTNQAEYDNRLVPRTWKHQKSHPLDQILTDLNSGVQTRSRLKNFCAFYAFLSLIGPKNVYETLTDFDWIVAM